MLIRSNQLTLNEASSILDNGVYLTEAEAALNPVAVPVLENQRLGICTVSYNDIQRVCEDNGYSKYDALFNIAEASNIDVENIAIAIDEADIILNPDVVNEFPQYVINPISENSFEYLLVETALELFLHENYDYNYLDCLLEGKEMSNDKKTRILIQYFNAPNKNELPPDIKEKAVALLKSGSDSELVAKAREKANAIKSGTVISNRPKYTAAQIKKMQDEQEESDARRIASSGFLGTEKGKSIDDFIGGENEGNIKAGIAPTKSQQSEQDMPMRRSDLKTTSEFTGNKLPDSVQKDIDAAEKSNNPGFISRKVAALRNFYKKFLEKANQEHDQGKIKWYKNIARVILNVIDKLLAKLDKTK